MRGTAISNTNIALTWTSPSLIYFISENVTDAENKAAQKVTNSIESW
jgi:hypothetical protein